MKEQLHLKNHLKEVRMEEIFSSPACGNGGCIEKYYQFHRNRTIQPNSKVSSNPLHCIG